MEWQLIFLLIFGVLAVLLLSGMPVVVAFILLNMGWVYFLWGGGEGIGQLLFIGKNSLQNFAILPVPLFVFLGEMLFQAGIGARTIDAVDLWLGKIPGRLGLLSVGGGSIIATLSGNTAASVAMLSSTLVPEMERRGYKKPMSLGPVLGSGGLAMMIPPSSAIIFLAYLAVLPIGKLLMAGIMPGLVMGALYASYIIIRCRIQPSIAPPYEVPSIPPLKKIKVTMLNMVPVGIIIFLVIGVIFLGIATPTEAAAMGALGALILAACYRSLTLKVFKTSLLATVRITIMVLAILFGALAFGKVLAFSGATTGVIGWVSGLPLPPIVILIIMQIIPLILGCFMDGYALMMMLIPLYMPIIDSIGFNPIWFVILLLINVEMGLTTPPFGFILFVMKGAAPPGTKMSDIYKAGFPFLVCDAIAMSLIIAFPQIALWLPSIMMTR